MRIKHYSNSGSLGFKYVFGLNIYKDRTSRFTVDLILGKHVFAFIKGENK